MSSDVLTTVVNRLSGGPSSDGYVDLTAGNNFIQFTQDGTTPSNIIFGVWESTPVALQYGGTNAALSASNGGIFYSTASAGAILSGTATARQVLLSGSSAAPSWSTATYPATTTSNQLLYSSSTNTVGGLSTANSAVLLTNSSGVPAFSSSLTNGQLIIGNTSATPSVSTLTAGSNVTITNGSGTITIAASATPGGNWVNQNSSSVTLAAGNSYLINNGASLVTLTLPTSPSFGDTFKIVGFSSGGWKVAQNASQVIVTEAASSTAGVSGFISSTNQYDVISITFVSGNNFVAYSPQGNITVS